MPERELSESEKMQRTSLLKDIEMLQREKADEIGKHDLAHWRQYLQKEYGRLYPNDLMREIFRRMGIAVIPDGAEEIWKK